MLSPLPNTPSAPPCQPTPPHAAADPSACPALFTPYPGRGKIVRGEWNQASVLRANIELGEFVVMPNHFHGIIIIVDGRGTARRALT